MAEWWKHTGEVETVTPDQGEAFSLERLQALVEGDIELVYLEPIIAARILGTVSVDEQPDEDDPRLQADLVLVCNENAISEERPFNRRASSVCHNLGYGIRGHAVLCRPSELGP